LSKVVKDNKEVDLKNYIIESMTKTDSLNIRQVENTIDYIANIFESLSETIVLLYEKGILNADDISKIVKEQKINIVD